jgi:murein endopeptidase
LAAEYGPTVEEGWVSVELPEPGDTGTAGCSESYLDSGVQLPDLPLFYRRLSPARAWGTPELIDLLVQSARHMAWLMPTASPLTIGDLSAMHGGWVSGHKSHRGGIDADVGLYRLGGAQDAHQFADVTPAQLDVVATWALIQSMLDTGKVDMILLDRGHIARLKTYALASGLLAQADAAQIFATEGSEGWRHTGVIRHVEGHKDHLHVRVLCPDGRKASG